MEDHASGPQKPTLGWHGFHDLMTFVKATLSLGGTIAVLLWAVLTYAVDERTANLRDLVHKNTQTIGVLAERIDKFTRTSLAGQIRDAKSLQCTAKSAAGKQYAAQEIARLVDLYISEYNTQPYIPGCEDL